MYVLWKFQGGYQKGGECLLLTLAFFYKIRILTTYVVQGAESAKEKVSYAIRSNID